MQSLAAEDTMSIKREVAQAKQLAVSQLARLRDEARVKLHLLSLDARQRWSELDTAIGALETRANQEGEKATDLLAESARELTRAVGDFMVNQMSTSPGLLTSVRSLMTVSVRACVPGDSLNRAAQLMWDGDFGSVPVLEGGTVVGLLTDRDAFMASYTQGKPLAEISVESAMSKQITSCGPDDSIGDALALMTEARVRRLPVNDASGKLTGILSLADIARWARSVGSPAVDGALAETVAALAQVPPDRRAHAAE
jgi:CBS domain-containing protein